MERPLSTNHAASIYPGHPYGDEDRADRDLDGALGRAEENAAALRSNGYVVERTDSGNDDVGVIREYHVAESGRDGDRNHRGPQLP
jgi:hypothetical protein